MKVLVDMNLSPRWVPLLHEAGYKATHWSEVGLASAPDSEIMAFANENDYVVLTHDLDFSAILARTGDNSPSVVQVRSNDVHPDVIGSAVLAALSELNGHPAEHLIVTVDLRRTRVRVLPFPGR